MFCLGEPPSVRDPPHPVLRHLADVQEGGGQLLDRGGGRPIKGKKIKNFSVPEFLSFGSLYIYPRSLTHSLTLSTPSLFCNYLLFNLKFVIHYNFFPWVRFIY